MLFENPIRRCNDFFIKEIIGCDDKKEAAKYFSAFTIWMKAKILSNDAYFLHCFDINVNEMIDLSHPSSDFLPISFVYIDDMPIYRADKIATVEWIIQYLFYKSIVKREVYKKNFMIFKYKWKNEAEKKKVREIIFKKFYTAQQSDPVFVDITFIQKWYSTCLKNEKQDLINFYKIILPYFLGEELATFHFATQHDIVSKLLFLPELFCTDELSIKNSIDFMLSTKMIQVHKQGQDKIVKGDSRPRFGVDQEVVISYSKSLKPNDVKPVQLSKKNNAFIPNLLLHDEAINTKLTGKLIRNNHDWITYVLLGGLGPEQAGLVDSHYQNAYLLLSADWVRKNKALLFYCLGLLASLVSKKISLVFEKAEPDAFTANEQHLLLTQLNIKIYDSLEQLLKS